MTANPLPPIPPIGPTTGLSPLPTSNRFKPIDPLRVIRQYIVILIVALIVGVMLGVGTWLLLHTYQPKFTSEVSLQVNAPFNPDNPLTADRDPDLVRLQTFIFNEMPALQSEDLIKSTLQKDVVRLSDWYINASTDPRVQVEDFRELISVRNPPRSSLIHISLSTRNSSDAPELLEALIQTYMTQLELRLIQGSSTQTQRLEQEFRDTEARIAELDRRIVNYRRDYQVTSIPRSEVQMRLERFTQEVLNLEGAERSQVTWVNTLKEQLRNDELEPTPSDILEVERSSRILQQDSLIDSLRRNREALLLQYPPEHRFVLQNERQIAAAQSVREAIFDEEMQKVLVAKVDSAETALESIRSNLEEARRQADEAEAAMLDLESRENELQDMETERQNEIDTRENLAEQLDDIRIKANASDEAIRVERRGTPTTAKLTFPRPFVVVPGVTIAVLGFVTALVFLKELLDQRVRSPQDLKLIPQAELLGVIPSASEDMSGQSKIERIVEEQPTGLLSESFRQVRTSALAKMDRRGYKTLVVCSAQPQAGASSIAQNLAASMALNGRNVVLLDANFRRPNQHNIFNHENTQGLVDFLHDDSIQLEDLLQPVEGVSMTLLPCGRSIKAAPEIIETPRFRELLSELETRFDVVIIDAAPALIAGDTQLLVKYVDALALVVRADEDHRGMVERMINRLDGQRADVLGVILNGVRSSAGGYFRKNYQAFHRYGDSQPSNGEDLGRNGKKSRGKRGNDVATNGRSLEAEPEPISLEPVGEDIPLEDLPLEDDKD